MGKKSNKKLLNNTTAVALLTSSIFGAISLSNNLPQVKAQTNQNAESILASLTPGQLDALKKSELNQATGLQLDPKVDLTSTKPISVIVQFKQAPQNVAVIQSKLQGKTLTNSQVKSKVEASHAEFKNDVSTIFKEEVQNRKSSIAIKREYKNVFNGVSMVIPANKVSDLLQSEQVQAVWSDDFVKLDEPDSDVTIQGTSSTEGMAESNEFLGINQLHEEGYTGKGVKVGVIDTGIDYNHPDLKDAYKGGYDFVDNDNDPMETTYADWKKSGQPETNGSSEYYTEHGTHVSGTIAGQHKNNSQYATTGIAPDADLYAYRVLGPYGTGSQAAILAGIEKSVTDGMDIINLSLGNNLNDPLSPLSIGINNAVLSGVTAVIAAGNSGDGEYTVGSPATAALALTVGASDVPMNISTAKGSVHSGNSTLPVDLRLLAKGFEGNIESLKDMELPIVNVGLGSVGEFNGIDVKDKVALIQRGTYTINEKIENAKYNGAAAVIIWNNNPDEGFIGAYLGEGQTFIPTFSISNAQGIKLSEQAASNSAKFVIDEIGSMKSDGDHLAAFSSRGPVKNTYDIKPEITAPGVSILSTVPSYMQGPDSIGTYKNAYARLNGTSMATPHVTGIAALLKQANPTMTPSDIKANLMNTADPLKEDYSVYEVGAGRVDPVEALKSSLEIVVHDTTKMFDGENQLVDIENLTGALSLGAYVDYGKKYNETHIITLQNKTKATKTYNVKVNFKQQSSEAKDAKANGVKLTTDSTITVAGSNKMDSQINLTIPNTAKAGVYEGYITYTNQKDPEDTYQVPFAFRYMKEGIGDIFTRIPIMTDDYWYERFSPVMKKSTSVSFTITAPMQRVDVILQDAKTGQDLGYIAGADASNLFEGSYLQFSPILGYGKYYPFTGNANFPISDDTVTAPPGHYKLKLIATGKTGKTYTKSVDFFIKNTGPNLTLDTQSNVIEYEKGQKTYKISGTLLDSAMKEIQDAGLAYIHEPITQADNALTVYRYENAYDPKAPSTLPYAYVEVGEDGKFSYDVELDKPVKEIQVLGQDNAGNAPGNTSYHESPILTFIEKGTTYIQTRPEQSSVGYNSSFNNTISIKNAKDWVGGTFNITYPTNTLKLGEIKPSPELEKLGKVTITTKNEAATSSYSNTTVQVKLEGENVKAVNGDLPLFTVEAKSGEKLTYASITASVRANNAVAINSSGETDKLPTDSSRKVNILPDYSQETFLMNMQGVKSGTRNMNQAGVVLTAVDQDGKEFSGAFTTSGKNTTDYFVVDKLPITSKTITLKAKIPGHTSASKTVQIGRDYYGQWIGTQRTEDVRPSYAGDVNGDEVIDILDAFAIETFWGTNKRSADINFDGIVDMTDFAFVEQNFLFSNPEVDNVATPKKAFKGKKLADIKKELESMN
ncbi:S8 family serine peptidase [Gottfriedia sp. NPDC056225]|uniref:S8 family serine peptidase n=1 Tax=Gottfriedia sp. NPDC056225 TaxID=3345751 RepID=UPI0035D8A08A